MLVVALVCVVGCGISVQAAVAAVTRAVRRSQAASAQHVPAGFTRVGRIAGTTLWLQRHGFVLDLRSTGAVTVSCTSPPVLANPTFAAMPLCAEPARSGTVVAYAVDEPVHGARLRMPNRTIVDATVLNIGRVVDGYRLIVAVLPGVRTNPEAVTYR